MHFFVFPINSPIFTNNHFKLSKEIMNNYDEVVIFFLLNHEDEVISNEHKKAMIDLYFTDEEKTKYKIIDSSVEGKINLEYLLQFLAAEEVKNENTLHLITDIKNKPIIKEMRVKLPNLNNHNVQFDYFACSKVSLFENKAQELFSKIIISPIKLDEILTYNIKNTVFDYILENDLFFASKIKENIKGHRLIHSISVANLCYKVAEANKIVDPYKYYICGLLHDLGKQVDENTSKTLMKKYFNEYIDLPTFSYHQFIGAHLALKLFKVNDSTILDAIKWHCTGNENMSLMSKIVYACDKIEPTRGYDSSDMINAMMENAESGFLYVLSENLIFIENKSKLDLEQFDRISKKAFKFYLNK